MYKSISSHCYCIRLNTISFSLTDFLGAELKEQLDRAIKLEDERRKVEQEAARLEAERMEAIIAKEELARQAENQIKSQEQLVSVLKSST